MLTLTGNRLSGAIPTELGRLSSLKWLKVGDNQLSGQIPRELGNLTNLQNLGLNGNKLSGILPHSLTGLSALVTFRFQDNAGLCAPADDAFQKWLNGVPDKSGSICPPVSISEDRAALVSLYDATNGPNWSNSANWLSDEPLNTWYGVITDASGRVIRLDLRRNQLSGRIPSEIGSLSKLTEMKLGANQLSGNIPAEIGRLSELTYLSLDDNHLTGEIPPEIGRLSNLSELYLGDNQLTGHMPPELGNLTSLTALHLKGSRLSGTLPDSLTELSAMEHLFFGDNDGLCAPADDAFQEWLNGIPHSSGDVCSPGPISEDRAALVAVYYATDGPNWANNATWLTDQPLDTWHGVTTDDSGRVTELELRQNHLSGRIPPAIGSLSRLSILELDQNRLTGEIPAEIANLSNLTTLSLSGNRLTGALPNSLTELSAIEQLRFEDNAGLCAPADDAFRRWFDGVEYTTGDICPIDPISKDRAALVAVYYATDGPNWTINANWLSDQPLDTWYGVTTDDSGRVTELVLRRSGLSGHLPPEIGSLSNLTRLYLGANLLSGPIPGELGNLTNLWGLSLTDNRLTGTIPPELGGLTSLYALELNQNQLSGEIPAELGNLSNLSSLSLWSNRLSGTLPHSLTRLSAIGHLRFEDNAGLCAPADHAFRKWFDAV